MSSLYAQAPERPADVYRYVPSVILRIYALNRRLIAAKLIGFILQSCILQSSDSCRSRFSLMLTSLDFEQRPENGTEERFVALPGNVRSNRWPE